MVQLGQKQTVVLDWENLEILVFWRFRSCKTLKISGVIGGESNNITFDNLNFQIKNAMALGYTEQSICGAVMKAICPSNGVRVYFETEKKTDYTL